ncbi:MAG: tetratricopeptide repeat protein [Bdellovibrionales bacterium]
MNFNNLIYFMYLFFIMGCASKKIQLVSEPPATVYVSSDFSSEFTELGTTPMHMKLKDHASGDGFTYLALKAEGHDSYRVVLPVEYSAGTVEVVLNRNEKVKDIEERIKASFGAEMSVLKQQVSEQRLAHAEEKDKMKSEFKGRSNEIFHKVMEVQNALHIKRLPKAAKALAELRALDAPEGLLLTLEGNFEFISGRPRRALASYKRALDIDPTNMELAGILKELKGIIR